MRVPRSYITRCQVVGGKERLFWGWVLLSYTFLIPSWSLTLFFWGIWGLGVQARCFQNGRPKLTIGELRLGCEQEEVVGM